MTPPPPGLQAERTAMAWQRTALALGGVSALLLHAVDGLVAAIPGSVAAALAVALLVSAELRYARTARARREDTPGDPRLLLAVAAGVAVLAVAALVLLATGALPAPEHT